MQLSDLLTPRNRDAFVTRLLQALKGIGHIAHTGTGTGVVTSSGLAKLTCDVQVEVLTSGPLGVATYRYTLDGGLNWSSPTSASTVVLGISGAILGLADGPAGAGESFVAGDTYDLAVWTPTFPVASWQSGSTPRTLVEMDAEAMSDLDQAVSTIAAGGFLSTAKGAWLTLLALELYGLLRKTSVTARHMVTLTDAAGEGPLSFGAGQLRVASGDLRFVNVAAGTIPASGSLANVEVEAERAGASYNVPVGSITSIVSGALPGVTVTNPDLGDGTSLTRQGIDTESDASLRDRCSQRWSTLGAGGGEDAYLLWAKTADPQVTRVGLSTPGDGTIAVTVAGDAGAVDAGVVANVDAYLQALVGLTAVAAVASAVNVPVEVAGTIRVKASSLALAQAAANAALATYQKVLPIGGEGGIDAVSREIVIACLVGHDGVVDADIATPAADVALASNEVAVFSTAGLTWEAV